MSALIRASYHHNFTSLITVLYKAHSEHTVKFNIRWQKIYSICPNYTQYGILGHHITTRLDIALSEWQQTGVV